MAVCFKCSGCNSGIIMSVLECPKGGILGDDCHSVLIMAASCLRACESCWKPVDSQENSIGYAIYEEAKHIIDAYQETFVHKGRWGFGVRKGPHEHVRINIRNGGYIMWMNKLQGKVPGTNWSLGSGEDFEKPTFLFGGHGQKASVLEGEVLERCVKDMESEIINIKWHTFTAKSALENEGFMIAGEFLRVPTKSGGYERVTPYHEDIPDWDFLQEECSNYHEDDYVTVVWKYENERCVKVRETTRSTAG